MTAFLQAGKSLNVLITGAASGIGWALAQEFRQRGHTVYATARKAVDLQRLADMGCSPVELEVTDSAAIDRLVSQLSAQSVTLDMLVNNAGYGVMGPVMDVTPQRLKHQFDVNVFSVVQLTQALVPSMVKQGRGRIVNISSVSGVLPTPFAGVYCASKAAVNALSDALRMELAPFGIEVITVQPGGIRSKFGDTAGDAVSVPDTSLYASMKQAITERAVLSQAEATPAEVFAREMVDAVLADRPQPVVRIGEKSTLMPMLKKWLPEPVLDGILSKRFGLDRLRAYTR